MKGQYRAGLTRLLKDAQSHKFQALLVWKLDRFARSIRESLRNMETLERAGVRFISTTQSIDTDVNNPASRLVVSVLAAAAQFEGELIRERTTAGLRQYQRAMKEGKVGKTVHSRSGRNLPIGRPKVIVNRDEIVRLKQEKQLSLRQIAKQVGVGLGTVTRILQAVPKT